MISSNELAKAGLNFRDAFADWAHVPADLIAHGADQEAPLVTIAIPTFRRPGLLVEAVKSAIDQRFAQSFEIIVVDNDPASSSADSLLEQLPTLTAANFRYFINRENIGQFPNHNRCIELARGEWVTILNDDDLLDPNSLQVLFSEISKHPDTDGIAPRKRMLDNRPGAARTISSTPPPQFLSRRINFALAWKLIRDGKLLSAAGAIRHKLLFEYAFGGKQSRRIKPAFFFWGNVLENGAGFTFRRQKAREMGGFYPEDHPSADFWFYTRFATSFHLRQHRAHLASVRMSGENTTVTTVKEQLQKGYTLQRALVGAEVPLWWRRILPMIMTWHLDYFQTVWESKLTKEELGEALQIKLPPYRPRIFSFIRLMLTRDVLP